MDCTKTGQLIAQLRKEKRLTQQQIADALNVSNKTISKWECGLGCPDLALWTDLSTILGVNMEKILEGELVSNPTDIGKMKRIRFYACPNCGNILTSTGEASISCCGRRLLPLTPSTPAQDLKLTVKQMDTDYYISFSHDMTKEHYLQFAAYVNDDRIFLHRLYPEQSPEIRIPLMRKKGTLFLYCTRHGLCSIPKFM